MSVYSSLINTANEIDRVARLASTLKRAKKKMYNTYPSTPKTQGRNEKCNCGSGLKFKRCCGREGGNIGQ